MKQQLVKLYHKIMHGHKSDSDNYLNYLRKIGVRVGDGTRFYSPWTIQIDEQRPYMIEIGKNVRITANVSILEHGFDWSVIQGFSGDVVGSSGKITIGDNVFIGQKSILLKGITIGNNVIIGAGSIVTSDIPDNSVVAGVPAKRILSLEEYVEKRKSTQFEEAKGIYREYVKAYGKEPSREEFRTEFWLFTPRNLDLLTPTEKSLLELNDNYSKASQQFMSTQPLFQSFEEFLSALRSEVSEEKA